MARRSGWGRRRGHPEVIRLRDICGTLSRTALNRSADPATDVRATWPIVGRGIVEVDHSHLVAFDFAVVAVKLDIDTFRDQPVNAAVLFDERRCHGGQELLDGLGASIWWNIGIEAIDGHLEASTQNDIAVAVALGAGSIRCDVVVMACLVAETSKYLQRRICNDCSAKPGP